MLTARSAVAAALSKRTCCIAYRRRKKLIRSLRKRARIVRFALAFARHLSESVRRIPKRTRQDEKPYSRHTFPLTFAAHD